MISSDQWIELPVGYNLDDHVGTDIQIAHPDIVFYDFYGAWNNPIPEDAEKYLSKFNICCNVEYHLQTSRRTVWHACPSGAQPRTDRLATDRRIRWRSPTHSVASPH